MSKEEEIRAALEAAFEVQKLEIINESSRHAGHAGDDGTGESHFHVTLRAGGLGGMSRVGRHRAVFAALGPELTGSIHALSLDLDG